MPSRIIINVTMACEERRKQPFIVKFTASAITVSIFLTGLLLSYISSIDSKLFIHLTNSDMHVIRSQIVSKGEFDIITSMRSQQFAEIREQLSEIKTELSSIKNRR